MKKFLTTFINRLKPQVPKVYISNVSGSTQLYNGSNGVAQVETMHNGRRIRWMLKPGKTLVLPSAMWNNQPEKKNAL